MKRTIAAWFLLVIPACATVPRAGVGGREGWDAPPLERAVSIRDGRTGGPVSLKAMLDALGKADVVFLGETHTDETTHRVELGVYEGLLARRGGRVVLALEMFERDVQPALDAYLSGGIDEPTFLARARPWGNYQTAYRPLIEKARAERRPVVASNFPQPLRQRLAREGPGVLASLEGDARRQAPAELLPNTEAYWRRADNAIRSHRGMMSGGSGDRLYSTQSLWDNAMGEACAAALDAHRGHMVLHVNGGFHSAYWDGTVHQLRLRRPQARVKTVAIEPVANPAVAEVAGAPVADYVVFAETRAGDVDQGAWSVYVNREHKYRLHVPARAGVDRVPLLVWLGDDGLTASDGLDLWRERLGDEAAILVLEPLHPELQADLSEGGRWFRPETFAEDVAAAMTVAERAWGYVLRHFAIDPQRVCVAGEGSGATVAAATALLTETMRIHAVALHPRGFSKIKDFPLPLPELFGSTPPPPRALRVMADARDEAWWRAELSEYAGIGLSASLVPAADPWDYEGQAESALREAMRLEARPASAAARRAYVLADADSPRARHWARLWALRSARAGGVAVAVTDEPPADPGVERVTTDVPAARFSGPHALPRCPGAFGGTTVIVVPAGASEAEAAGWVELEKDDPINKTSRFHRLRIAREADGQRLADVLARLESEGRTSVLVAPATFCADAAFMRALRRSVREREDRMTIHWLPGLGGQIAAGASEPG